MSSGLNLSSLKDKIFSKLNLQKDNQTKSQQKSKKASSNDKEIQKIKRNQQHQQKQTPKTKGVDEILRREALALGATDEDLKLVEGIESDDDKSEQEFDDDSKLDKNFSADLSKFMKGIGLGEEEAMVVSEEEEEEVPELVEGEEEEEEKVSEDDVVEEEEEESISEKRVNQKTLQILSLKKRLLLKRQKLITKSPTRTLIR